MANVNPDLLISNPTKLSQVGSAANLHANRSFITRPRFESWFGSLVYVGFLFRGSIFEFPAARSTEIPPFLRVSTSLAEDTRPFSAAPQGPSLNERLLTPCSQKRARRGVTNGVPAAFWPVECRTTPHAARLIGLVIVSSLGEMKWNESDCRSAFRLARLSYGTQRRSGWLSEAKIFRKMRKFRSNLNGIMFVLAAETIVPRFR